MLSSKSPSDLKARDTASDTAPAAVGDAAVSLANSQALIPGAYKGASHTRISR